MNAWSDQATFSSWFHEVFLPHIRSCTSKPVLLVMENCSGHGNLTDPHGQVSIAELPPNCTSKHQPMDMGVIAAWKQRYQSRLLTKRTELLFIQETLHQAATAKKMKKGEMSLADGKNVHVLDAAELGKTAWEEISQETIAHCWIKADILPPILHMNAVNNRGKPSPHINKDPDVLKLVEIVNAMKISGTGAGDDNQVVEAVQLVSQLSSDALRHWMNIEEEEDVHEAIIGDLCEEIQKIVLAVECADGEENDEETVELPVPEVQKPPFSKYCSHFEALENIAYSTGQLVAHQHLVEARMGLINAYMRQQST